MRTFLKTIVLIPFCALALAMGAFWLRGFEFWKVVLWCLYCMASGNIIYRLFRKIDKKHGSKKQAVKD